MADIKACAHRRDYLFPYVVPESIRLISDRLWVFGPSVHNSAFITKIWNKRTYNNWISKWHFSKLTNHNRVLSRNSIFYGIHMYTPTTIMVSDETKYKYMLIQGPRFFKHIFNHVVLLNYVFAYNIWSYCIFANKKNDRMYEYLSSSQKRAILQCPFHFDYSIPWSSSLIQVVQFEIPTIKYQLGDFQ